MKRFTSTEIGGLILAISLFFVGLNMTIWPEAGVVSHFTNDALGLSAESIAEIVSSTEARFVGILAMLFGVGIAVLAIYREKP